MNQGEEALFCLRLPGIQLPKQPHDLSVYKLIVFIIFAVGGCGLQLFIKSTHLWGEATIAGGEIGVHKDFTVSVHIPQKLTVEVIVDGDGAPVPGGDVHIVEVPCTDAVIHGDLMEDPGGEDKGHSGKGGYIIVFSDDQLTFVVGAGAPG